MLTCFHGPLADPGLRALIPGAGTGAACRLPGLGMIGGDVPVPALAAEPGGEVTGWLADLAPEGAARLGRLAGALGLMPVLRQVAGEGETREAVTHEPLVHDHAPWQSEAHPGWGPILAAAAEEILDGDPAEPAAAINRRLPTILARAASRAMAMAAVPKPAASGLTLDDVTILERRRPYANFFAVEELTYAHRRFDGTMSEPVLRAVFMAADAVTVLPYDPVRDRVLLVEQVRASPIARGDHGAWILEPVAGRIEPGHTPEATAIKEAAEEAGLVLRAEDLRLVGDYYPSTGAFSEYVYSFIGLADLPDGAAGLGGLAEEGEDIRGHLMPRAELMRRIEANECPDAPLIISALWLDRNLASLRGDG